MSSYSPESGGPSDPVWQLPAELSSLRPEATEVLARVNQQAWAQVEPALVELLRLRMAVLIGNRDGSALRAAAATVELTEDKIDELSAYPTSARFSARERECLSFAEQFVMDVSGTTAASLGDLADTVGRSGLADFVRVVYVVEFTQRLQMMAQRLLTGTVPEPAPVPDRQSADPAPEAARSLREVLADYQDAVVRGTALDPITTELVRLRCARSHRCRICSTLRLGDARSAGVDETMTAKIDFYEQSDLPERYKVALRLTDAFITRPDTLSDQVVGQARTFFSPEELAELCLDITKWSTQKIHVALGTDGADAVPLNEDGTAIFDFDPSGRVSGYSKS
jgi:alkylhydroperoxidase family enzyme